MSRWSKKARAPPGYDYIEPVMDALEKELREKMSEPHEHKRACESLWPVHQINWQRSRYVYDLFYKYKRISRQVYEYCIKNKLVDANLIAKWKKPGYERLCSTHAICTKNFNYGTVSICRVPRHELSDDHGMIQSKHCGCRGCASGPGGFHNIFGNKYGQHLARIQVAREAAGIHASVWATEEEEKEYDSSSEVEETNDEESESKSKKRSREDEANTDESEEEKSDDSEAETNLPKKAKN